jgi:tetratricopeptide (TPR) repeat protein
VAKEFRLAAFASTIFLSAATSPGNLLIRVAPKWVLRDGFLVAPGRAFVADYALMSEGSSNAAWRRIAAILATVAAAWFCYAGAKHALASHYALSASPEDWERAARIEPDNPETWYHLARYRQLDFDNTNIPLSISYYQRAMQLNPRSPYYKLDLAGAYEMAGNNAEADNSFRAAQAAYPISSEVSWKYGNFLLRQNRFPEAYGEIHRAVMVDPKLLPLAVSRVWHSDPDVQVLLDQVLPDTPEADSETLSFLVGTQDTAGALEVWRRLIPEDPHTAMNWGVRLTDMLLGQSKFADAAAVWRQTVGMNLGSAPAYTGNSLVYDGGFERNISGGGFGWQQRNVRGAEFDFDPDVKHSGSRSARLTFDGTENLSYQELFQHILVSPGDHYHFEGFLRTDQISTNSGMRFEIVDPKDPQHLDLLTVNETGTIPWTLEELDFTAGTQTHLIEIRLAREPSERLDNKLNGTVWIDDVSLVPAVTAGGAGGPGSTRH